MKLAPHYAHALWDIAHARTQSKEESEALIGRFLRVLEEKGHSSLLPHILSMYVALKEKEGGHIPTLLVANKEGAADAEREVAKRMRPSAEPLVVVDETLIGGYVYKSGTRMYDTSYKRALLELYQRLIVA